MRNPIVPSIEGWVLYDDSCGFCRRWIPFWASVLRRRGYGIAPLQTAWIRERLDPTTVSINDDLRLLYLSGAHVVGADVYRHIMRRIWWAYPVFLFVSIPGVRGPFNWAYQTFARNRFRFSAICGLAVPSRRIAERP